MTRATTALLAAALVASCTTLPYQPLEVRAVGPIDAAAFARAARVVAAEYPSLAVENGARRMRSDWEACIVDGIPSQRRVAVFQERDDRLALVVEFRRFEMGWWTPPRWGSPRAHAAFERQLAARLEVALRDDGA